MAYEPFGKGRWPVDDATPLDLDLSALLVDDFEVANEDLVIESLTADGPIGIRNCPPCVK